MNATQEAVENLYCQGTAGSSHCPLGPQVLFGRAFSQQVNLHLVSLKDVFFHLQRHFFCLSEFHRVPLGPFLHQVQVHLGENPVLEHINCSYNFFYPLQTCKSELQFLFQIVGWHGAVFSSSVSPGTDANTGETWLARSGSKMKAGG